MEGSRGSLPTYHIWNWSLPKLYYINIFLKELENIFKSVIKITDTGKQPRKQSMVTSPQ